jgi:hypothetical protein
LRDYAGRIPLDVHRAQRATRILTIRRFMAQNAP